MGNELQVRKAPSEISLRAGNYFYKGSSARGPMNIRMTEGVSQIRTSTSLGCPTIPCLPATLVDLSFRLYGTENPRYSRLIYLPEGTENIFIKKSKPNTKRKISPGDAVQLHTPCYSQALVLCSPSLGENSIVVQ